MTVEPLPLPDDGRFRELIDSWPDLWHGWAYPRSVWLGTFEDLLREHYPHASSDQLTLTARLAAPFPLALPGVP